MLELKDGAARAPVSNCPRAATKSTLWRSPAQAWIGEVRRLATRVKLLRETDELLKDDTTGQDVKELFKEAGLEDIEETKDEAPDELDKDVAADDATGHHLQRLVKDASWRGHARRRVAFLRRC